MPEKNRKLVWLIHLVAVAVGCAAFVSMPWWTVDDAFISYRYGRNLLVHGQLTWNPGDLPCVEGYTGILLPLVAAAFLALDLPLVDGMKILSMLALVSTLGFVIYGLRRLGVHSLLQGVAVLFLSATPLIYMHALSGLETMLFTLFITSSMVCLLALTQGMPGRWPPLALVISLVLGGLTRPEGIVLAVMVAIGYTYVHLKQGVMPRLFKFWGIIWLPIALLVGYWLWRANYYDSFFPNSYHAKKYDGLLNVNSIWAFCKFAGYYCFLPSMALGLLILIGGKRQNSPAPWSRWVAIAFAGICLLAYFRSHLWMNYGSRFFFPLLPVTILFIFEEIVARGRSLWQKPNALPPYVKSLLGLMALLQLGVFGFRFHQEWAFLRYYHSIVQEELIPVGQYLSNVLPPNATLISYMDAGAIGYYSRAKVIDFGRLSDTYLAQGQPFESDVLQYFFAQNADAVVISSEAIDSFSYIPEAMAIVKDPRFQQYQLVKIWGNSVGFPYWQRLYLRKQ